LKDFCNSFLSPGHCCVSGEAQCPVAWRAL